MTEFLSLFVCELCGRPAFSILDHALEDHPGLPPSQWPRGEVVVYDEGDGGRA